MKYFTLLEFTDSYVARINGIDNTPSEKIKERIVEFVENLLDPLREAWGEYCEKYFNGTSKALRVSSGYRCPRLNEKVGGSATSVHKLGYAVDLVPYNCQTKAFFHFCKDYLADKAFDQLIFESDSKGSVWVHIGYKNKDNKQRRQVKTLYKE